MILKAQELIFFFTAFFLIGLDVSNLFQKSYIAVVFI